MLAHASGATERLGGLSTQIHKGFTRRSIRRTLRAYFRGGWVRRAVVLTLFVLGESALALFSFGVAAVPAFLSFLAGGALLVRAS